MKWRFMRFLLPAMLALVVADAPALAQRAAKQAGPPAGAARRERLERQVTERLAQVVRRELGLDDAGMRRLQQTNQRFEGRRRELVRRERTVRAELRKQLAEGKGVVQINYIGGPRAMLLPGPDPGVGEPDPVDLWKRNEMGVEITGGAAKFGVDRNG